MEELLTVAEVAEWLKRSKSDVYRKAKKNEIPHLKIGNSYRFSPSSVQEWMKKNGNFGN